MKDESTDFVLHIPSEREVEESDRSPHWIRVQVLNDTLPYYDWIFYTDVDTFLTNPNVRLQTFVEIAERKASSPPFLIVQDGMEINSGGFFIRNTQTSFNFLQEWWDMYEQSKNWRFARTTYDQVPFFLTMLRFAYRGLNVPYDGECETRYWQSYGMVLACWNSAMSNIGLILKHRTHTLNNRSDSIVYYHDEKVRGFNMIYTHHDEKLSQVIHPLRIWRRGDFIAHVTHSTTDNINKRWKHLVEYFQNFRFRCPRGEVDSFEHSEVCYLKPCHDELWSKNKTYQFQNMWSDYVPQKVTLHNVHEELQQQNAACESFLELPVQFDYGPVVGDQTMVATSIFRAHATEHMKSRVLDFVYEAADHRFFLGTWDWIESVISGEGPRYVCMELNDGLSKAGRFNPGILY